MEIEDTILTKSCHMMLEAMTQIKEKKIDAKEGMAIAALGKTIVDTANAETQLIRVVRGLPRGGVFGNKIQYLEPQIEKPRT